MRLFRLHRYAVHDTQSGRYRRTCTITPTNASSQEAYQPKRAAYTARSVLAPVPAAPSRSNIQENPRNRLSRFTYISGSPTSTRDSELILLTSSPKFSSIHSGGWVGFKPSDYGNNVSEQGLTYMISAMIGGSKSFSCCVARTNFPITLP